MILAYSFFIGLFVTMVLIPVLIRISGPAGILDYPNLRKVHDKPIPRVGGIAIAAGALASIVIWLPLEGIVLSYIVGGVIVLCVGIWDDIRPLDYKWKFLGQSLAVACVIAGGLEFSHLPFFGLDPVPGYISYPITFLFLLGITNAVNLFDGLDGLAGGCILVSFAVITALAYLANDMSIPIVALAISGGILGFLRFNAYPAIAFMGDAGSQFLGFTAAFLALLLTNEVNPALNPALPLLILGLPVLDTLSVIIRRILQRRSPFRGDRQHIHHRLLDEQGQRLPLVDIHRAMQRDDAIGAGVEPVSLSRPRRLDRGPLHFVGVDHDVADPLDARIGNSLGAQVLVGVGRRRPQEIGDGIGDDTVDLFGHGAVAAAEPRLEVGQRNTHLGRDERASQRRVHVAHHHHPVGPALEAEPLVGHHHARRLPGVAAAAHPQMTVGAGEAEVAQERVRHVVVVMLTGVDEDRLAPIRRREHPVERRHLHEIGPGAGDEMDFGWRHGERSLRTGQGPNRRLGQRLRIHPNRARESCAGHRSSHARSRSRNKPRSPHAGSVPRSRGWIGLVRGDGPGRGTGRSRNSRPRARRDGAADPCRQAASGAK